MKVLVTGGASGLGLAITQRLAAEHEVVITYCRSEAAALALPGVKAYRVDFTDEGSLAAFLAEVDGLALDALVNSAIARFERKHAHKVTQESWLAGFQHNVLPVLTLTNKVLEGFRKRRSGRIVNVLTEALVGVPPTGMAEYAAGKAFLDTVARAWAHENAKFGVSCNSVLPAMIETGMHADVDERLLAQLKEQAPLGRFLQPEEVAEAVAYFVGCSAYVNGARLVINGGG